MVLLLSQIEIIQNLIADELKDGGSGTEEQEGDEKIHCVSLLSNR
jgi:hypothetical protein